MAGYGSLSGSGSGDWTTRGFSESLSPPSPTSPLSSRPRRPRRTAPPPEGAFYDPLPSLTPSSDYRFPPSPMNMSAGLPPMSHLSRQTSAPASSSFASSLSQPTLSERPSPRTGRRPGPPGPPPTCPLPPLPTEAGFSSLGTKTSLPPLPALGGTAVSSRAAQPRSRAARSASADMPQMSTLSSGLDLSSDLRFPTSATKSRYGTDIGFSFNATPSLKDARSPSDPNFAPMCGVCHKYRKPEDTKNLPNGRLM